jgi:nitrate reductase gamma subunit
MDESLVARVYAFVSGPMVWIAFALFFGGLVVQTFRFFKITRKKQQLFMPKPPPRRPWPRTLAGWTELGVATYDRSVDEVRRSIAGSHPVMTVVTVLFHVLLFATPIFLVAHNTMLEESIVFHLPSVPEGFSDFLTFVVILCAVVFLVRRVALRRVRVITTAYDYVVLAVTAAPFVTGFLAYHQVGHYLTMVTLHVVTGELMLILVPFTRLGHALFFFLYRFLVGSEYSFGQGTRAW